MNMKSDAIEDIADRLERSRSKIESKFSTAGTVLEGALAMLSQQLESLGKLNEVLDADAVDGAMQDLNSTSAQLSALPTILADRDARLNALERSGRALHEQITEMRGLLKYLLVFALNVKITAAERADEASQFEVFAREMQNRIAHGETELNDFEARLTELGEQIQAAQKLEADLGSKAAAMLPEVPNRLSINAAAIGRHHKQIAETTASVSAIAQRIQLRVANALSTLQIGDITRQRIEHVESGLATLADTERQMTGATEEARLRLRRFTYRLLAAQLADTSQAFDHDASKMLRYISEIAADTEDLLKLQRADSSDDTGARDGLRSLEERVAEAVTLVSDMDQATASANGIRRSASLAVDELVARVSSIKSVKEDVQFMALNTTVRCARMGDAGKPLQVIAIELRLYAKKLDTVADQTFKSLKTLESAAIASGEEEGNQGDAKPKLEAAAARLRVAADVAESNLAVVTGHCRDVVESLSQATSQLNFKAEFGDVLSETAEYLFSQAGDEITDTDEIAGTVSELLERIARSYTMAREREVHAEFASISTGFAQAAQVARDSGHSFEFFNEAAA